MPHLILAEISANVRTRPLFQSELTYKFLTYLAAVNSGDCILDEGYIQNHIKITYFGMVVLSVDCDPLLTNRVDEIQWF